MTDTSPILAAGTRELEQLFAESGFKPRAAVRAHVREVAHAVFEDAPDDGDTSAIAHLVFASELFAALALELVSNRSDLEALIDRIELDAAIPRIALGREVLRRSAPLQLPKAVALQTHLELLVAFARASAASVWALQPDGELTVIAHVGDFHKDGRAAHNLARELLVGLSPAQSSSKLMAGIAIERWQQSPVALVAQFEDPASSGHAVLLDAIAPTLGALLGRDGVIGRGSEAGSEIAGATERRLTRLRFDLHDGPQQDVILLADDLRLFRGQLESVLNGHDSAGLVLGRLEDLQARLVALDGDLRRISASMQSPFLRSESLLEAIQQLADTFASRTEVQPEMCIEGELERLTDSQQIAILAVIREALSNIREHSEAAAVSISVLAKARSVDVAITDDGLGFDPQTSLVKAARTGHLGLVGMHERVRLLGGRTQIDSRPGGPTVITVTLPAGRVFTPHLPG